MEWIANTSNIARDREHCNISHMTIDTNHFCISIIRWSYAKRTINLVTQETENQLDVGNRQMHHQILKETD